MKNTRRIKWLASVAMLLCNAAGFSFAQEDSLFAANSKLGFFEHGSVVNLERPLEYSKQEEMQMGPTKGFDLANDFKLNKAEDKSRTKDEKAVDAVEEKAPPGVDPVEFALKKEFGDPNQPVPVKGVDNSPAPYKAMLKAMDSGRDDLALQYAEQWMVYLKSLDRVKMKAMSMSQVVGLRPDQIQTQLSPETLSQIDSAGLKKYLDNKKNGLGYKDDATSVELEQESVEKINALFGEAEENASPFSSIKTEPESKIMDFNLNPEIRRKLMRQYLKDKLPYDPSGKIKILFFFKPSDSISEAIGQELAKTLSDPKLAFPVAIVPLSIEPIASGTSNNFINATGLPALVRDGVPLFRTLKINKAPAVVFVSSASDKSFIQTGPVDSVFLNEVISMIGGK